MNLLNYIARLTILYFFCLSLYSNTILATPNGIHFFQGDWEMAKAQAHQENKPIFVEIYADWLEPCHNMEQHVFSNQTVSEYFNRHFVNYKININSELGQFFKTNYNVVLFPDLLFFSSTGNVLLHETGEKTPDELLTIGEKVILKGNIDLESMQRQYTNGYKNPPFLYDFAYQLKQNKQSYIHVVNDYIDIQTLKSKISNLKDIYFIYEFAEDLRLPAMDILLQQQSLFNQHFGETTVNEKIRETVIEAVHFAKSKNDKQLFKKAKQVVEKALLPDQTELLIYIETTFHGVENTKKYLEIIKKYMKKYKGNSSHFLHQKAVDIIRISKESSDLQLAKDLLEQSLIIDPQCYNNETYIYLLYKIGEPDLAKTKFEEAVTIHKCSLQNVVPAQQLIDPSNKNHIILNQKGKL